MTRARGLVVIAALCAARPAHADGGLRGIDWCNRAFGTVLPALSSCRGETEQRHRAGEGMWGVERYHLTSVAYGDLTGDGHDDALLVFEVSLHPVMISEHPPAVHAVVWLIEQRGDTLFQYTTESADTPPTTVTVDRGAAVLTWRDHRTTCTERWTFAGEGESAVKSPRACSTQR